MRLFSDMFAAKIEESLERYPENTLIVFKGFAMPQVQQVLAHPRCILQEEEQIQDGYLQLPVLEDNFFGLVYAIDRGETSKIAIYEHLQAISEVLPKVKVEKIVVVENNLLSPWMPSCLPYADVLSFFDFLQSSAEPSNETLAAISHFYSAVKLLPGDEALLLPAVPDDERIEVVPFWAGEASLEEPDPDADLPQIEAGSIEDWVYSLHLTMGEGSPALLLVPGGTLADRQQAMLLAAAAFGISLYADELELYREKPVYDETQFLSVLRKYWGESAAFRQLLFYRDPDHTQETESLSQGQVIAEIVDQCELAKDGEAFSNIFITAPTGSGKSILFQIPAIYLAEKYNMVTIVVSPLIALMNDQVDQLQRERGVTMAACINSSMSIEERQQAISRIQSGEVSLLYLAPELLLTTNLQSFLAGRALGLVVIDEAHTVTSWGRDFRSDYWFLGDFLAKTVRDGFIFPVLCLTATAVYSGKDDVVNDTIRELGLDKTILHLGSVRRENIDFDICLRTREKDVALETEKMELTLQRMRDCIEKGEKALAYFPFTTQVDQIYLQLKPAEHEKIRRYHGKVATSERRLTETDYKAGRAMGLFCTKAFGMGVDVSDITHVIHFAPSGGLSDYIQEIGRAARNPSIQGIAHIDFFSGDTRYMASLYGMSEMRQYQLREMMKKLCDIFAAKKRRSFLVSPDTFSYLFQDADLENRTKSGLMLLAKDLNYKYTFPVLVIRPRTMLSRNYVNVPAEIEGIFLKKYGQFATFQENATRRVLSTTSQQNPTKVSNLTVYSMGKTYLMDMEGIWERYFTNMSFGMFKKAFFEESYKVKGKDYRISPRIRVTIRYQEDFATAKARVSQVLNAFIEVLRTHKNSKIKQFTIHDLENELAEALNGEKVVSHDKFLLLADIFTETVDENAAFTRDRSQVRVMRKHRNKGSDEPMYYVSSVAYAQLPNYFIRQLDQCAPNDGPDTFFSFYPLTQNRQVEIGHLLRLMELLNLASYEVRGGERAEIFVRINDPAKLKRLAATGKYTNSVLQTIQDRHRWSSKLLQAFFKTELTTEDRWELVEQYFLGNEDYVRDVLHLEEE